MPLQKQDLHDSAAFAAGDVVNSFNPHAVCGKLRRCGGQDAWLGSPLFSVE
jgi:hypothetical protein